MHINYLLFEQQLVNFQTTLLMNINYLLYQH